MHSEFFLNGQGRYYAGIGSRETPDDILKLMQIIAERLESLGWRCRSGGAIGADSAFAKGIRRNIDIYRIKPESEENPNHNNILWDKSDKEAMKSVAAHHPKYSKMDLAQLKVLLKDNFREQFIYKLLARNYRQLIGKNGEPNSEFIICWTVDGSENGRGKKSGGTGQALEVAKDKNIRVFNLNNKESLEFWKSFVEQT